MDELEKLLDEAAADIDCPMLTGVLPAILLFADDIVHFSYSASGLQYHLDVLNSLCTKRGVDGDCKEDKEPLSLGSQALQLSILTGTSRTSLSKLMRLTDYLGVLMHCSKGLSPATECLCKAAQRSLELFVESDEEVNS